jgi:hypothetical protein
MIQESGRITEMTIKIDGKDTVVKLDAVQGLFDAEAAKVTEMKNEQVLNEHLTAQLEEMIDEDHRDKVRTRVSIKGATKESITAAVKAEAEYIKEMIGDRGTTNRPRGNAPRKDAVNDKLAFLQGKFGTTPKTETK